MNQTSAKHTYVNCSSIGSEFDILGDSMAIVNHTGVVQWTPPASMKAWCKPEDLGYWPNDFHQCNLLFGFWNSFHSMRVLGEATNIVKKFQMEWNMIEAIIYHSVNTTSDLDSYQSHLNVVFKLKRASDVYNTIFFTPFVGKFFKF